MADPLEELFGPVKTPEAAPPSPQAAGPDPLEQMFGPAKGVAPPPPVSPHPGLLANDPADSDTVAMLKNAGTGAVKGVAGTLLDLPNMVVEYLTPVGVGKKLLAAGAGALERRYSTDETRALKDAADRLAARTGLGPSTEDVLGVTGEYVPETTAGKIGQKAAEGFAGAAVLPIGATSSLGKFAANLVGGAASGAAGGLAREGAERVTDNKLVQAAAELAGNVATPLAGGAVSKTVGKLAQPVIDTVGSAASRLTERGQRAAAGTLLRDAVRGDPEEVARIAERAEPFIPGGSRMASEATGDIGLESLDRARRTADPDGYGNRFLKWLSDNQANRHQYIQGLQDGDPMAVKSSVNRLFDDMNEAWDIAEDSARQGVRWTTDDIGRGVDAETIGPDMLALLERQQRAARAASSRIFDALERRNRNMEVGPLKAGRAQVYRGLTPEELTGVTKAEQEIGRFITGYGDVVPFNRVRALEKKLTDAMATERSANGKSQAWRRLSLTKDALRNALSAAALTTAEREAQAVARGRMKEQDTLAAVLRGVEADIGAEISDAFRGVRDVGGVAGSAPVSGAGVGAGDGAAGAAGAGLGKAPPVRYLPAANRPPRPSPADPPVANFTDRDRADLRRATEGWRDQARTFEKGSVGQALGTDGRGDFRLNASAVPSRFFRAKEQGGNTMDQFLEAAGPRGQAMARDYAIERMWSATADRNGNIDPDKLAKWRENHGPALSRIEGLSDQLVSVEGAQRALADVAADRARAVKDFQKTMAGKLLGVEDPGEVGRVVTGALARPDGAAKMRQMVSAVQHDPDALDGLRKSVLDEIHDKKNVDGATFRNYLRNNRAALEVVFTPDQMKALDAIDLDIAARQHATTAQQIPGGPNTARDLARAMAVRSKDREQGVSLLSILAGAFAGNVVWGAEGAAATAGAIAGTEALRRVWRRMKNAGMNNVDDLIDRAMFDPKLLAELLRAAPPNPGPLLNRVVTKMGVRALQGGLPNPEQDDEPGPWRPRITPERKN